MVGFCCSDYYKINNSKCITNGVDCMWLGLHVFNPSVPELNAQGSL